MDSGVLVAKLFECDPRLADVSATEVTKASLSGLTHKTGKNTVVRFPLHGKRAKDKHYYVTVFVHPPQGEQGLYFIDGFQQVFAGTDKQALEIALTPVE